MENEKTTRLVPVDQVISSYAPNYISAYTNNVQFAVGMLDISLIFGEIINVNAEGKLTVEQKARITMNPIQAVILRSILNRTIKLFEQRLGRPLEMPQELKDMIRVTEDISEG